MLKDILNTIISFAKYYLPKLIGSAIIIVIGFFVAKIIKKIVRKYVENSKLDDSLEVFIINAIDICIKIVVVLAAISNLGVSITGLVAIFSAAAVAVSLALKDSLGNIAAGIVMLLSQPFSTGDFIEVEGIVSGGTVLKIDIVHTTLLTPDCRRIVIPNGQLVNKTITDFSKEKKRRMDLKFNISYNADFEKAKAIIKEVAMAHPMTINKPEPFVRVCEHGDSAVVIALRVWCKADNYWNLHFDLLEQVKSELDKNNIEIPYNQLDVHIIEK